MLQSMYQGTLNTKCVAWAIDRQDGKVKLVYLAKVIPEGVSRSLPMPYDVVVNDKRAWTKEVVYSLVPMPRVPITQAELDEFGATKPIDEVVARLIESQNVTEVQAGENVTHVKDESERRPRRGRGRPPARRVAPS
ncbi:MAG: hypothetical protein AB7U83_12565 [Vicinamibacterales bacterium]